MTCLCSYLDKDNGVFLLGDDIDFAVRAVIVGLQDAIAPLFQVVPCQFLAENSGLSSFNSSISDISPV